MMPPLLVPQFQAKPLLFDPVKHLNAQGGVVDCRDKFSADGAKAVLIRVDADHCALLLRCGLQVP
jgi:hypothetical protein